MRFALPGLIALVIVAFVQDMLPGPIRFYVLASVVITLLMALVTGQVHKLGEEQAAAARRHDPDQTLNRRQMAVVKAGIIPTIVLMVVSCLSGSGHIYMCKFILFAMVAIGAILLYLLRDKHPPQDQNAAAETTSEPADKGDGNPPLQDNHTSGNETTSEPPQMGQ